MIRIEAQTNLAEYKFSWDLKISNSTRVFREAPSVTVSPLAAKLFGFPWTVAVTIGPNFVVLEKQSWIDWAPLLEPLVGLLKEHLVEFGDWSEDRPPAVSADESRAKQLNTPLAKSLRRFIDQEVNPMVKGHGGQIELVDLKEGVAFVEMRGGCQGCGFAGQTLKLGIEKKVLENFPEIRRVEDVTDHGRGINPFHRR